MIRVDRVIQWMNVIRDTSGTEQYRLLENFWASQLNSKMWLIDTLKTLKLSQDGNVYIFGGWYGVLASLIKDNFKYNKVYSIDIDPYCKYMGTKLDDRIEFVTGDMKDIISEEFSNTGLIINTSTEHVYQPVFDQWLSIIPTNIPIVLQGNDFFSCIEHVRCSKSLEEFKHMNRLTRYIMQGSLQCDPFTRWMTVGYK